MKANTQHTWRHGSLSVLGFLALTVSPLSAGIPATRPAPLIFPAGGTSVVLGDFDGDHHQDFAVAQRQFPLSQSGRYRIDVQLSGGATSEFEVNSPAFDILHVTAIDVDGDHDVDLVISTQLGGKRLGVWINNGAGQFSFGDPALYPVSIWLREGRLLETPARPFHEAPPCTTGGFSPTMIRPRDRREPVASAPFFARSIDRPSVPGLTFPSSPFRAPPLA